MKTASSNRVGKIHSKNLIQSDSSKQSGIDSEKQLLSGLNRDAVRIPVDRNFGEYLSGIGVQNQEAGFLSFSVS